LIKQTDSYDLRNEGSYDQVGFLFGVEIWCRDSARFQRRKENTTGSKISSVSPLSPFGGGGKG